MSDCDCKKPKCCKETVAFPPPRITCDDMRTCVNSEYINSVVVHPPPACEDVYACVTSEYVNGLVIHPPSSVFVNAPITGNGTITSPLDLDLSLLSAADICALGNAISSGTATGWIGYDSSGCLVKDTLHTTAPLTGTGTATSPLDINFAAATPADLCALFGTIGIGAATAFVGVNDAGCPVQTGLNIGTGLTGNGLSTPLSVTATAPTPVTVTTPLTGTGTPSSPLTLDYCAMGADIPSGALVSLTGLDSAGCLATQDIDCGCNETAEFSSHGLGCVSSGGIGNVQFFERATFATLN